MSLIFDIETNGLLNETTVIHSLVIYSNTTGELISCTDHKCEYEQVRGADYNQQLIGQPIWYGLKLLEEADEISGHNIVKFDIPTIQKLYSDFKPKGKIFDTLLMSKLVYPDVGEIDDRKIRKGLFPKKLRGRYSLRAWGYRLK